MSRYCPNCGKTYPVDQDVCPDDGISLIDDVIEQMEGREIDGRYRVLSRIGEGGMGLVYLAEQMLVDRKVALKVVRGSATQDRTAVTRFFQEAKAIAGLNSAHTVTLYDFGMTGDGLLYYAMELLEGESLADRIDRTGGLPLPEAAEILRQVLDSLAEAHEIGILHRDLKPGNIFLSTRRGQLHATVLDFGIAKLTMDDSAESVTKTGHICGTPAYISPELALGRPASPSSDLYSIGVIFYEMLTGTPPFDNDTPVRLLMRHISEMPLPVRMANPSASVSDSVEQFISVALAKTPEARFAGCEEFLAALDEAEAGIFSSPDPDVPLPFSSVATDGSSPPSNGKTTTIMEIPLDREVMPSMVEEEETAAVPPPGRGGLGRMMAAAGAGALALAVLLLVWQPWSGASSPGAEPDLRATPTAAVDSSEDAAAEDPALVVNDVGEVADVPLSRGVADIVSQSADVETDLFDGTSGQDLSGDVREGIPRLEDAVILRVEEVSRPADTTDAQADADSAASDVQAESGRPDSAGAPVSKGEQSTTARPVADKPRPSTGSRNKPAAKKAEEPAAPERKETGKAAAAEPPKESVPAEKAPEQGLPRLEFKPVSGDDEGAGKGPGLDFKEIPETSK